MFLVFHVADLLLVTIVGSLMIYDRMRPRLLLQVALGQVGLIRRLHKTNIFLCSRGAVRTHAHALVVLNPGRHVQGLKVADKRGTLVKVISLACESKLAHFPVVGRHEYIHALLYLFGREHLLLSKFIWINNIDFALHTKNLLIKFIRLFCLLFCKPFITAHSFLRRGHLQLFNFYNLFRFFLFLFNFGGKRCTIAPLLERVASLGAIKYLTRLYRIHHGSHRACKLLFILIT